MTDSGIALCVSAELLSRLWAHCKRLCRKYSDLLPPLQQSCDAIGFPSQQVSLTVSQLRENPLPLSVACCREGLVLGRRIIVTPGDNHPTIVKEVWHKYFVYCVGVV